MACARIRAERCPLFGSVPINADSAPECLPLSSVPYATERGAVEMDHLEHFAPNLSGPASRHAPFSADQVNDDAKAEAAEQENEDASVGAPAALIAKENANVEFLIGLDGSPDDDAVGKMAAFRAKVHLAEEYAKRVRAATLRVQAMGGQSGATEHEADASMNATVDLNALLADRTEVCVHLRFLARSMGDDF